MLITKRLCIGFVVSFFLNDAYCWNSVGHRVVAQIAYNHLTEPAKKIYNQYNHALAPVYGARTLVGAASWLDSLQYRDEVWLQPMHYINIPFSRDGTELHPPNTTNAVFAIEQAVSTLKNNQASLLDKGFSVRLLMHVVGDIHQPMHAVSEYSMKFPTGGKGGNLVRLTNNEVAKNLHAYWDNGGGLLIDKHKYSKNFIRNQAKKMEAHYPCDPSVMEISPPQLWADESHQLAINKAYKINKRRKPSKSYQRMVKKIAEQRISLAGCRLAQLLNEAAKNLT